MPNFGPKTTMRPARGAARAAAPSTRNRILDAAGRVFAEHGFRRATVREICKRAGVNIAAVNYHFGDKMGLYTDVLRQFAKAIDVEPLLADRTMVPEQLLREIIRMRLRGVFVSGQPDWALQVITHEWTDPTPAMGRVVNETLRPLYKRFREIVGKILGLPPDHETTRLCVHSVMGQAVHYVHGRPMLQRLWPELKMTPEQVDRIADHIADFSLAALRALRQRQAAPRGENRRNGA